MVQPEEARTFCGISDFLIMETFFVILHHVKLNIALFQIKPSENSVENFRLVETNIQKFIGQNIDIVLLPELWNIGYSSPEDYPLGESKWKESALTENSEGFVVYRNLAKDSNVAILLPYLEKINGGYANSAALIDRRGNVILNY